MSFADTTIEVDGCRTHLRRGGAGSPLVFLHGATGAPVILPFMEKLAQRFDVLVPEHPVDGCTDEPEWLENIHDVAYFYLDFIKHLQLEDIVLIGGSLGGWIAMEMAVRDTSRLRNLILVGPAGIPARGVEPADIFLLPPEEVVRRLYHDEKLAQQRLAEPLSAEAIDIGLKNRHTTARLGWEPRLHDPFLPKWLHRIDVPVKIIWGKEDRILPVKFLEEYKRLMPRAEVDVFDNCGHLPQAEMADRFVDSVVRFAEK